MLVKGSYYTGTDDGAVNLIKIDSGIGSEYIIDLMGAPGTLIPAEVQDATSGHEIRRESIGEGVHPHSTSDQEIEHAPVLTKPL